MNDNNYPRDYHFACLELIEAMAEAANWTAVQKTYKALQHVRQLGRAIKREADEHDQVHVGRCRSPSKET